MKAVEWLGDKLRIIDQTGLPHKEDYRELVSYKAVACAIRDMLVRGAPAIGVTAAYGIALGAGEIKATDKSRFLKELSDVIQTIAATRPTARNLFAVTERMKRVAEAGEDVEGIKKSLADEAVKIHAEEEAATESISRLGAELIEDGCGVLTHCNTGPLATAGYGTALGVIIYAHRQGKRLRVFATETRPRCQGARLTAWELKQANVPFTLITDSMAGYVMKQGEVGCVIVGADRIAANGDTANKIGTYSLAVLAKEHGIPFYVAAPTTTIDPSLFAGDEIPIEQRSPEEVTHIQGVNIAPEGVEAANPAFDVTPQRYITAIITEKGIIRKPYYEGIKSIP
ncbi:S-methyl-5-thioribose-1-phosphate isomerase [Chloroflexota bacterium]